MSSPIITVSGPPGSGTTTLCRLLQDRLKVPYTYAGQLFREEAEKRDMSLSAFGDLCEVDPRVDQALDLRQKELLQDAKDDGLILEGRLAGWHAHREEVPAVKVWLDCKRHVRLQRIVARDGEDLATQVRLTSEREASEADRYLRYYDIDLGDMSPYDLVLDSTDTPPDELAERVVEALGDTV